MVSLMVYIVLDWIFYRMFADHNEIFIIMDLFHVEKLQIKNLSAQCQNEMCIAFTEML